VLSRITINSTFIEIYMNKKIRMRSKDGNISLITEPLIFAIRTGNKEFVRTLLKNNINLNE